MCMYEHSYMYYYYLHVVRKVSDRARKTFLHAGNSGEYWCYQLPTRCNKR